MKFCDVSIPSSLKNQVEHPLSSRAKVLLTSVFGPYALDDEYGSRLLNPMELYHNQVTRVQGPFSLRMFHRSCGLMMIQANIQTPCTVLDYPTMQRFNQELETCSYDIIGVSGIPQNLKKVQVMCDLIRQRQPSATVVVGGHITNIANLADLIDADYIVRGDGIRWFRTYLGEDAEQAIRHPQISSTINPRCMGVKISTKPRDTAAVVIPSVGCPVGCNFCTTSAMFGGKGKYINFYETGDELFDIMRQLEKNMGVRSFFIMDDNFLFHRKRALRLLELMQEHQKSWSLYTFGSADVLSKYTIDQLLGLGVSWLWLGLEGENSRYEKLKGADTKSLVRELQENGIRVLGSSMIGLENHTPENIDQVIDYAVSHDVEFHQFMLYTPAHGTPLREEIGGKGLLLNESEIEEADIHGQYRFNYRHPHIPPGQETGYLLKAFKHDFDANGPSIMRMIRTLMKGWLRHKYHPDRRIRERFAVEVESMPTIYAGALWAIKHWFKNNAEVAHKAAGTLEEIYKEFGLKSRISAPAIGLILTYFLHREDKRLKNGVTYEPPTFYESSVQAVVPQKKLHYLLNARERSTDPPAVPAFSETAK